MVQFNLSGKNETSSMTNDSAIESQNNTTNKTEYEEVNGDNFYRNITNNFTEAMNHNQSSF
jgi:hypothetical protein